MNQSMTASLLLCPAEANTAGQADRRSYRMSSIDILRGLVIVLMALDHVRDFTMVASVQDPTADARASAALFFTRWITHFCAPTFVFLAGTSAGLMMRRKSPSELGQFLLTRGLWLVFLEIFVISTASSFAPGGIAQLGGHVYVGLQVIWAIGASMVALAACQYLGPRACLFIGVAIILGHNLLDGVWPPGSSTGATGPLWAVLHSRQVYEVGPFSVYFSYPLLPWIGIMFVGYGSAALFQAPPEARDRQLIRLGCVLVLAFVLIRAFNTYGDPHRWHADPSSVAATLMSFLATTKYPPSLLYTLMTLGPAAIVCASTERLRAPIRDVLLTFGRAPLAFYVAHLYLIHVVAVLLGVAQGFAAEQFLTHYRYFPKGYGVGLGWIYVIWIAVVVALYPLCRWVSSVKARRTDWWLSYV